MGIDEARSVDDIFAFYSADIYRELARVTKTWIVVRGSDFYHPPDTCDFYAFQEFALRHRREAGLELHALYSYKQTNPKHGIYRKQLQVVKGLQRPIISHSQFAVFRKEAAA